MISWLKEVVMDNKTGMASSKRFAHILAAIITAMVTLIVIGIITGLSVSLPAANFEFVYSTLNSTLITLVAILTTGSAGAYVLTKNTEKGE